MMLGLKRAVMGVALTAAAFGMAASVAPAYAAKPATYTRTGNVAVSGYDTVSFFKGAPVQGLAQFQTTYNGAVYQFANAENLAAFKAAPTKYAPQYGGYCAYAVSQNNTAPGSPQHYTVVDGKLYLNLNGSIETKWRGKQAEYIQKANANWPKVVQ